MQVASMTAAAALSAVGERVAATAQAVAAMASPEGSGDVVDLSAAMVALLEARNQAAALTGVMKTADEIERHALDVLG